MTLILSLLNEFFTLEIFSPPTLIVNIDDTLLTNAVDETVPNALETKDGFFSVKLTTPAITILLTDASEPTDHIGAN